MVSSLSCVRRIPSNFEIIPPRTKVSPMDVNPSWLCRKTITVVHSDSFSQKHFLVQQIIANIFLYPCTDFSVLYVHFIYPQINYKFGIIWIARFQLTVYVVFLKQLEIVTKHIFSVSSSSSSSSIIRSPKRTPEIHKQIQPTAMTMFNRTEYLPDSL